MSRDSPTKQGAVRAKDSKADLRRANPRSAHPGRARQGKARRSATRESRRAPAMASAEEGLLIEEQRDARRWRRSSDRQGGDDVLDARLEACGADGRRNHAGVVGGGGRRLPRRWRFAKRRDRDVATSLRSKAGGAIEGLVGSLLTGHAAAVISHLTVEATRERRPRRLHPREHDEQQPDRRKKGGTHQGLAEYSDRAAGRYKEFQGHLRKVRRSRRQSAERKIGCHVLGSAA